MDIGWRVGVFGGTFDPPHIGHSIVAAEVVEAIGLDHLLWVPARIPPHKRERPLTPAAVRRRMVEAAIRDEPGFALCDLELGRKGVSYTVDTLRSLRARHPGWMLHLVFGAELLAGFASWKEPEAIRELARPVALLRGGAAAPAEETSAGVRVVPVTPVAVSSSRIRSRVALGMSVTDMVTPPVLSIIEGERLYRPARGSAPKPGDPEKEKVNYT